MGLYFSFVLYLDCKIPLSSALKNVRPLALVDIKGRGYFTI